VNPLSEIKTNYQDTVSRIGKYTQKYRRAPGAVRLIAVSKRHSAGKILEIAQLGHQDFAENYVQEGVEKIESLKTALRTLPHPVCWHFIGHIQSRKSRLVAEYFDWVHTVDSIKVAQKLDQHRRGRSPLNVLIQLNLHEEESKYGINENQLDALAGAMAPLRNLKLRGLMIIPKEESEFVKQRQIFHHCQHLLHQLNRKGFSLDQLSMGMTNDMEAAIAEGATQVRIGTAIFGRRPD